MTEQTHSSAVSEPEVSTVPKPKRSGRWSVSFRLGLRNRYLLFVAVIAVTAIPLIGWVVWHELNLQDNLFASQPTQSASPAFPPLPPESELIPVNPVVDPLPADPLPQDSPDDARLDRLEEQLAKNTELLERLEQSLQSNEDAHLYMAEKVDLINEMNARTETLSTMMHSIAMQVDALSPHDKSSETAVDAPQQPGHPPATSPPFRLMSIDKWQHDWYAVLELDGLVAMVTPPDSRAGWEIVHLNPTARKALFRNTASGTEHELEVE